MSISENQENNPLVSICTLVYNQEKFLKQYLEGIFLQKINFSFEILIHDDASTDNSGNIIREYQALYPNIIKPIIQTENQYSKGTDINLTYNFPRAKGKYIAICEGDDYWTDPCKLQKQVDFLETHSEYNLCCHDWQVLCDEQILPSPVHSIYTKPLSFTFATLPWVWITKSATLMFRSNAFDFGVLLRYRYGRDVHIVYHALFAGKGYFMPEVMAAYRVHSGGIWSKHDADERNRVTYELYKELYSFEKNRAVRKRYMNATLAYFNGLLFSKKNWKNLAQNTRLYAEAWRNTSDFKDVLFCLGGIIPTNWIKWVMKTFKI